MVVAVLRSVAAGQPLIFRPVIHEGGFEFGWNAILAIATFALAAGTVYLALQARNEARSVSRESREVSEQVSLQREQVELGLRPYVVPAPGADWLVQPDDQDAWRRYLPVKNAGPGVALNVRGGYRFGPPTGVFVSFMQTSLAPNDEESLLVEWAAPPRPGQDWEDVIGRLDYEDINGRHWATVFRIYSEGDWRRVETLSYGDAKDLEDTPAGQDFHKRAPSQAGK